MTTSTSPCRLAAVAGLVLAALVGWDPAATTRELHAAPQAAARAVDHGLLDQILDLYVRDGLVYYRALQIERARFDRYLQSLTVDAAVVAQWSRDAQVAFWLNGYNSLVLKTVIDRYPIRGTSPIYPSDSIRQIPGAFDGRRHRIGGRDLTLDEIAQLLTDFGDARVLLALGRGAVGSGRLRSEAFMADRLDAQLAGVEAEFATTPRHVQFDRIERQISVSPLLSWHEAAFIGSYGAAGDYAERSPIEQAILALLTPHLLPLEREFLRLGDFAIRFHEFDWRLNDLTGGRP